MYEYNICNQADEEMFTKQCAALEKNIPNLRKDKLLIDVDETKIQSYKLGLNNIVVYNDYCIGAVYIRSEIELKQYFPG